MNKVFRNETLAAEHLMRQLLYSFKTISTKSVPTNFLAM